MLHSYDEIYTAKAQTSLAQMLRYAEEDMHIELNEFWDMFLISGNVGGGGRMGSCLATYRGMAAGEADIWA